MDTPMVDALPVLTTEEFTFFEIAVRIRQCELRHRSIIGWDDSPQSMQTPESTRLLLNRLWGTSYELPIGARGTKQIIGEYIADFQTCSEAEAEKSRAAMLESSPALGALIELKEFLRCVTRYSTKNHAVTDWFEFGLLLPTADGTAVGPLRENEESMLMIEARLGLSRALFLSTSADPRRKLSAVDPVLQDQLYWTLCESAVETLRRKSKANASAASAAVPTPEISKASEASPASGRVKKPRVSKEEADRRVTEYLSSKRGKIAKHSGRGLHREIMEATGLSHGAVSKSPAFVAVRNKIKGDRQLAPRGVQLTEAMLQNTGRADPELTRVFEEQ